MSVPLILFALEQESRGLFADRDVLYTGVGKVQAAHALTRRLHTGGAAARPRCVVNLGTAGSAIHKAGSLVHCTRFIQRDMDVSPLGFPKWETPFSGRPAMLEYGDAVADVPHAVCGTGDSFEIAHDGAHYDVVDMEAYALAHVCRAEDVPFYCLKYVSDGADGKAADDWGQALDLAAQALRRAFDSLLPSP